MPGATLKSKHFPYTTLFRSMTDANGLYSFTGLTPGTYSVQFVQPVGFNSVSPLDAGGDDTKDSDANPAMMLMTAQVTLASGDNNTTLDAGFYITGSIAIKKYVHPVTNVGGEGLTPGFWKQTQHFSDWVGYTQSQNYNTVFGVNDDPTLTLLGALQRGGGGMNALGRQAVAALLNASNPNINYFYTV